MPPRLDIVIPAILDAIVDKAGRDFCYGLELLVKCHRLGWPVADGPAKWFERKQGGSRFQTLNRAPAYLRSYGYAFAATFLRKAPGGIALRSSWKSAT
jgi:hypothetical protein